MQNIRVRRRAGRNRQDLKPTMNQEMAIYTVTGANHTRRRQPRGAAGESGPPRDAHVPGPASFKVFPHVAKGTRLR